MSQTVIQDYEHGANSVPLRRKVATTSLWILQVVVAAFFIMGGMTKLAGAPEMIALFDAIGIGQWFRYLTGILEAVGALLLVVPGLSGLGALVLASVMAGAILTHLVVIGGSAAMALTFFVVSGLIVYARRDQLFRLAGIALPSVGERA